MAIHNYVIANQGFPAFRSDLNDVLQAIVSNNSNATAPTTTYAYQMWYETDTNNWYMRNADNDAWITLATFDQVTDTVNFIDSSTTVAGISTTATATVLTLADGSVAINPAGFVSVGGAATQSGEIRFLEDTDNGSNYIALKPAAAIGSNSTLTLPEATDTLVGLATTDTLTNKTLTAPKIGTSILDTNGAELFLLTATASAVNEFTVTNSATGNAPNISATGGDTNIDLNLTPKGIGRTTFNGQGKIQSVAEKVTTEATAATGTVNYDVLTQAVWNFTDDASANWTLNVRGDGSNSLDSIMDTGESITIAHLVSQGATAYYNSAVQIDGNSVTPKYQGGSAPSAGNASSIDVYSYTIIKTGSATFTVLASQTQFA
jgi:hypothetical protein